MTKWHDDGRPPAQPDHRPPADRDDDRESVSDGGPGADMMTMSDTTVPAAAGELVRSADRPDDLGSEEEGEVTARPAVADRQPPPTTAAPPAAQTAGPPGASDKRRREFAHLRDEFRAEGRYPGREDEVAARVVNKQWQQHGETKAARDAERAGQSPDRDLPIDNYQQLTVPEIIAKLADMTLEQVRAVQRYEGSRRRRKTLLVKLERVTRAMQAERDQQTQKAAD